MQCHNITSTVY